MYAIFLKPFACALPMKAYPSIPTPISRIPSELTRPPSFVCPDLVRDTKPPAAATRHRRHRRHRHEDFARNLGPRADDHALRSWRVPARARRRIDRGEGIARGRGAGRPHGRLRVPLPAGAVRGQPRRGAGSPGRARHLRRRDGHAPEPVVREGRPLVARGLRARRGAGRSAAHGRLRRRPSARR